MLRTGSGRLPFYQGITGWLPRAPNETADTRGSVPRAGWFENFTQRHGEHRGKERRKGFLGYGGPLEKQTGVTESISV